MSLAGVSGAALSAVTAGRGRGRGGAIAWPLLWSVAVLLALEAIVVALGIRPFYLPRPSAIATAFLATPEAYLLSMWRTLLETVVGFAAGGVFGVAMGVVFHRWATVRELFFPLFVVSQTIPVIAFGAVVVLWFGNTLLAKAVISFYISFLPVTVNALLGFSAVNPRQVALMRSFGASEAQILKRLYLPAALPQIFVALKLAASLSLIGAIVGEWFGDTTGLGVLLLQAMYNENVVGIWVTIVASACLGVGLNAMVSWAERWIVFWGAEP